MLHRTNKKMYNKRYWMYRIMYINVTPIKNNADFGLVKQLNYLLNMSTFIFLFTWIWKYSSPSQQTFLINRYAKKILGFYFVNDLRLGELNTSTADNNANSIIFARKMYDLRWWVSSSTKIDITKIVNRNIHSVKKL